jgi:hypothetical protein
MTQTASATGRAALLGLSFLAFVAFSVFAFSRNYAHLAFGIDGVTSFLEGIHAWKWAPPGLGFGSDPFQGMSDLWSGESAFLTPAHLLYALTFGKPTEFTPQYLIAAYTIFACELFLSVLLLARSLEMGWLVGTVSAWTLSLLAYPYFGYSLLYPIFMSAPSIGTTMSECALLLAAVAYLGRGWQRGLRWTLRRDLGPVLAILLLLTVMVAANPFRVMLWTPVVAVVSLGLVLGADAGERLPKFVLWVACSLIVLVSGIAFLVGMFSFTTPRFWSGVLENTITDPTLVSIWYGQPSVGPQGPKLFAFGVFGIITALIFGSRRLRWCAASLLLLVGAIFLFGYGSLTWKNWRGPALLYFEFMIWPFYAIFAVWAAAYWVSRIAALAGWLVGRAFASRRFGTGRGFDSRLLFDRAPTVVMVFVAVAVPVFAFARVWPVDNPKRLYVFPPALPPMVQYLRDRIGLTPGAPYRGRVVTMELADKAASIGWLDIASRISTRYLETGNDYFTVGLWYYDIPTLFEYSASTSPAFFGAVTRLLARPGDRQLRSTVVLRQPNAHNMALFGVRFVIVDKKLPDPFRLIMTEHTYRDEVLSLYEVPDVNLGTSAPTQVTTVKSFADALDRLGDPNFDFRRSVVVFSSEPIQKQLNPVEGADVKMIRGGFSVEANSSGWSLLVLPFEFSHCLQGHNLAVDAVAPHLLRVNALETGVLFEKHVSVEIEYFTGLFHNPMCRIQDSQDFSLVLDAH